MKTALLQSVSFRNILLAGVLSFSVVPVIAEEPTPPQQGPLIIEEFADFECSYCAKSNEVMNQLLSDYKDQIKLVFRNAPLDFHANAMMAAKAYVAVALQDQNLSQIWRDEVFRNQIRLTSEGEKFAFEIASQLGINIEKMKLDMASDLVAQLIAQDRQRFEELGFKGTPSFLIGTESVQGSRSYEEFKQIIDRQLKFRIMRR
jgi:protein-disulfide isomerase